jgi:hypothetical protein
VWTGDHLTKESFVQKPMEFAKGHMFFRISQRKENSFGKATYCVPSEADFSRYLSSFGGAFNKDAHRISFTAKDTVRIPDLHTQLNAMHRVMVNEGHTKIKPEDVVRRFSILSGGGWDTPRGRSLIDILKSQGYHGIVDQMDAGTYGENPLVLFGNEMLGRKTAVPLSSIDLKHFADILTDIPNRR